MENGNSRYETRGWLRSIEQKSLGAACVLLLGSLAYRSVFITLGVFLGAAVSLINFRLLWKIAEPAFRSGARLHGRFALRFVAKMIGLLAAIFLVIYLDIVNVVGFAVGLSSVVMGIVLEGIIRLYSPPRPET